MAKLRIRNGNIYVIKDYATPGNVEIILDSKSAEEVLATLTEENLSEIRFMTDSGAVNGVYKNKLLRGYVDSGETLAISIEDADQPPHDPVSPPPQPDPQPTIEERTKALEDRLDSYEAAYIEGVNEA